MGGLMSKRKGQRGEYEVCALIQCVVDLAWQELGLSGKAPKIERNVDQARYGGTDIIGLPFMAFEVKYRETPAVDMWWEQTRVQARMDTPGFGQIEREPVLLWRANHKEWAVRMYGWLIPPQGGPAVKTPVDISLQAFESYLKLRLVKEFASATNKG